MHCIVLQYICIALYRSIFARHCISMALYKIEVNILVTGPQLEHVLGLQYILYGCKISNMIKLVYKEMWGDWTMSWKSV